METNRTADTRSKFFYGYVIVAVTFAIMLMSQGIYVVFGVFFDPLLEQFGWTRAMISGAYSLSSILGGALGIVMGWLTDRFGPRLVVTFSGFILGLGYILVSRVNTLWQFYLFYGVIVGIGMGGLWVPLLSPIVRWFVTRTSLMTAIVVSGVTVGQLIAPLVISRLIAAHGWRISYIILGSAVMVIIVILAQFMRRDPGHGRQLPDRRDEQGVRSDTEGFSMKAAAHTVQFWLVAVIFFCVGFAGFSVLVHIVPDAINLGVPAVTAANILAISGGIGIVGNFGLGGFLGDRIGNRKAFLSGMVLVTVSLFWLVFARQVWTLYLFAVVFGIGLGGMGTSESPLMAELFGRSSHGLIYGVIALCWTVGGAVGPIVVGYMCDRIGNYQLAFLLCAIVGVLGLFLLTVLRPTKKWAGFNS